MSTTISSDEMSSNMPMPSNTGVEKVDTTVVANEPPLLELNEEVVISQEELASAVDRLNVMMSKQNRDVHFSVDSSTGKDVVRVTDQNTGALVRQLPSTETLNFIRNLDTMMGLIFNDTT